MGVRSAAVLSACLLALKGHVCQSVTSSSVSVSGSSSSLSSSQPYTTNAITVPAVIKPVVQPYNDCGAIAPSVPNYGSFAQPPMPPIIITDGGNGGSNNWLNLLFLIYFLNRRGGYGGGYGGCYGGGCGGGYGYNNGCGGGYYNNGYGGANYNSPRYYDAIETSAFASTNVGGFGGYSGNSYASTGVSPGYNYGGGNVAEIAIAETIVIEDSPPNPYQYPTIQTYPGRDPTEIVLIVRADSPSSCL